MRFGLFDRFRTQRKIPLNDLARAFWQDRPVEGSSVQAPFRDRAGVEGPFDNRVIQNFWLQYVRPYQNTIPVPVLQAIEFILSELANMESCPSVSEADDETPKPYQCLYNVALIDHLLNVGREAVDILKNRENDFQMNVGKILIAALAHDVGKHPTASIPNMPHSFRSAMWIQKRISELKDREQIVQAVRLHHAEDKGKKTTENQILSILIRADRSARQKELMIANHDRQMDSSVADPSISKTGVTDLEKLKEVDRFSRESFLYRLKTRVTCIGFDAFFFGGHLYFSPSIVENEIAQLLAGQGHSGASDRSFCKRILSFHFPEVRNEKVRLRFKNDFRPTKKWFYIFDASVFGAAEQIDTNIPRDAEGRWLKDLDRD